MDKPGRTRWIVRILLALAGCVVLAVVVSLMEHRRPIVELERAGASVVCEADGSPRTISFCSPRAGDAHLQLMSQLTSVSSVNLGRSSVTPAGLKWLVCLPRLQALDLSETDLGDGLLEVAADFPALRTIQLRHCPWVTDEDLQHLLQLDRLECLLVSGAPITDRGLAILSDAKHLKQLGIDGCSLITDNGIRQLARFRRLETVTVDDCNQVSDAGIRDLAKLPSLRHLTACGIPMQRSTLTEIVHARPDLNLTLNRFEFPELQPLVDAGARIGLDKVYNVRWVEIDDRWHDPRDVSPYTTAGHPEGDPILIERESQPVAQTAALLDALHVVPDLPALHLKGIAISESGFRSIGQLKQLRRLVLEGTPISDADLHLLTDCRALEALSLRRTPVTGEGVAVFRKLPQFRELSLLSDRMTQAGFDAATSLDNLETLVIGDVSQITAADHIARMPKLSNLVMVRATLTADDMRLLTATPRLQHLELLHANLRGDALSPLAEMPGLKSLHLARCEFDRDVLDVLRDRRPDLTIFGAAGMLRLPHATHRPEGRALLGGTPLVVPHSPSAIH